MLREFPAHLPVTAVTREDAGMRPTHASGSEHFDPAVLTCHNNQS